MGNENFKVQKLVKKLKSKAPRTTTTTLLAPAPAPAPNAGEEKKIERIN